MNELSKTLAILPEIPITPDMLFSFSIMAFLAGGFALVTAGVRQNNKSLARRIEVIQSISKIAPKTTSATAEHQQSTVAGFSDPEYKQLLRMFGAYNISANSVPTYFLALRLVFSVIAGIPVLLFLPAPNPVLLMTFALGAAMIAWFLPIAIVQRSLASHRKAVGDGLPDTLELMAICVESGISLEHAIQRVSQEIKLTQPALADELALTWAEISILPSRDQALENLAKRVDLPAVRTVVGTLAQSLRFGSPLAQSLRVAATEMRNEQLTLLEERANRLPALMTLPVMVLIMPTIFLIVGGPAVIRLLDVF